MRRVTTIEVVLALGLAAASAAQETTLGHQEITQLARAQLAITAAHDSMNARLAKSGNKKDKVQAGLQDTLRAQVAEILHHSGLTDAEFRRRTYLVSTDTAARRLYDSIVVVMTGAPLPGQLARGPQLPVPPGPVGTHLGHVVNGFGDTPNLQGLLPTALAEARIAAQHATLASAQPTNLQYMQTHAGHVLHALDPKLIANGPGLGYGVKRASTQTALHIELAATTAGAAPAVITHAPHIATAARNTVQRVDQLVALAQRVQAATSAADAAALVNQMVSLANQLIAGADINGDGRVTAEEGGLQLADEHVRLMLGVK